VKKDYNKNDKTSNDTHKNIAPEEVAEMITNKLLLEVF